MPCFQALQCAPPSSSHPASESPFCNMPHFQAHQPIPPSSSPPESESSFPTCHVSELTNPLLPLPPLQQVSPCYVSLWCFTNRYWFRCFAKRPISSIPS